METNKTMVDKTTQIDSNELPTGCNPSSCSRNVRRSSLKPLGQEDNYHSNTEHAVKFSITEYSAEKLSDELRRRFNFLEEEENEISEYSETAHELSIEDQYSQIEFIEIPKENQQSEITSIEESIIRRVESSELTLLTGKDEDDMKDEIMESSFDEYAEETITAPSDVKVNVLIRISSIENKIFDENDDRNAGKQLVTENYNSSKPRNYVSFEDLVENDQNDQNDEETRTSEELVKNDQVSGAFEDLVKHDPVPKSSRALEDQVKNDQISRSPKGFEDMYKNKESNTLKYNISSVALDIISFNNGRNLSNHIFDLQSKNFDRKNEVSLEDLANTGEKSRSSIISDDNRNDDALKRMSATGFVTSAISRNISIEVNIMGMPGSFSSSNVLDENQDADVLERISVKEFPSSSPQYNLLANNLARNKETQKTSSFREVSGTYDQSSQISDATFHSNESESSPQYNSLASNLARNEETQRSSSFREVSGTYDQSSQISDAKFQNNESKSSPQYNFLANNLARNKETQSSSSFREVSGTYDQSSQISDATFQSNELKSSDIIKIMNEERFLTYMTPNGVEETEEKIIDTFSLDKERSVDDEKTSEVDKSSWRYDSINQPELTKSMLVPNQTVPRFVDEETNDAYLSEDAERSYTVTENISDILTQMEGRRRTISFSFDQPSGSDVSRSSGLLSTSLEVPGFPNIISSNRYLQHILDGSFISINQVHVFWNQMKKECLFVRSLFLFLLYYLIYLILYCGIIHQCVC